MSWIGLNDLTTAAFNIRGIGVPEGAPGARPPATADEIIPVGTLLLEVRFAAEPGAPQEILSFTRNKAWARKVSMVLSAEGRLELTFRQGQATSTAVLDMPPPPRDSRLRISYSWHAPQRAALLTVEMLDEGRMFQTHAASPVPLPVVDAKVMMRNGRATTLAPEVRYIAVSDAIEPVGLGSGIAEGTMVETPHGPVPVERLRLGDMVQTAVSGAQPVRWVGKRTVPALGGFRPIRLRAPFFGLGRDLTVAPDHRIRLGVAEAEYMLGEDEVLIEASHLINAPGVKREGKSRLVTYYQVLLDMHDCLLHEGLWTESLFVGTLARTPDVVRSTVLAEMPISAMPQHRNFARHRLSGIEARSLAAALRA